MTVFAILLPNPQPALAAKIMHEFGDDSLEITDTQWLVSATGTSEDIVRRLGIFDRTNPAATATGFGIVFATSGYFGRAPSNIWEWLKVKLEAPAGVANVKTA